MDHGVKSHGMKPALQGTYGPNMNIYIFTVIVYGEAVILVAVYFSMRNIKLSRDVGRALGWSYVDVSL